MRGFDINTAIEDVLSLIATLIVLAIICASLYIAYILTNLPPTHEHSCWQEWSGSAGYTEVCGMKPIPITRTSNG